MDDFLTVYRKTYLWPATGRILVRGPRPPPDPASTRAAIETWEKDEGLCSAAWSGSHEVNIGAEWLRDAAALAQGGRKEDNACTLHQQDRIGMAYLRALQLERSQLERKITGKDNGPRERKKNYTSTYQSDYTRPGVPPVDAMWSFTDLIAMSRGVACEKTHDWPAPAKDRSGDRCQWGETAAPMSLSVKRRCHKRPTRRVASSGRRARGNCCP